MLSLRRSVVQRCGVPSVEMSSLHVGAQQVSSCGRVVVSGSTGLSRTPPSFCCWLSVARTMLYCGVDSAAGVAKFDAGEWVRRGTVRASPTGRVSVISGRAALSLRFRKRLASQAALRPCSDPVKDWDTRTHLLTLFIIKHSLRFWRACFSLLWESAQKVDSHLLLPCIFSSLLTGGKHKDVKRPLLKNTLSNKKIPRGCMQSTHMRRHHLSS